MPGPICYPTIKFIVRYSLGKRFEWRTGGESSQQEAYPHAKKAQNDTNFSGLIYMTLKNVAKKLSIALDMNASKGP